MTFLLVIVFCSDELHFTSQALDQLKFHCDDVNDPSSCCQDQQIVENRAFFRIFLESLLALVDHAIGEIGKNFDG